MKRKRGRKPGHKKAVKSAVAKDLPKSPASPSTEDNSSEDQTDNAPLNSEVVSEQALSKPEKPITISNKPADVPIVRPKVGAVYGRVKVKLKSSKVLEPHQSSSDVQTPSDVDKSNNKVPEEINEIAVEKDTALSDGQTLELKGSDADKMPRKVGSIKIKSRGIAYGSDVTQDKNANKVDDPLPSNHEIVSENKRNADLLVPNNLQGEEVKQPPQDRQPDKKQLTAALEVIKKVMKMDAAEPFNTPVDPVALGIPDYFDIIDTPMDFGTICHDLERGNKYMNSEDVYKDVQFIWDNCSKYNSKGDYIMELMKRVKKAFMKNWLAAGLYSDVPDSGANDNANNEDVMPAGQEKGHPKSKSKHKRRRHGVDRHKNDCLCAVCVVTRRRKEREENLAIGENQTVLMNSNLSEQHHMEENSPVDNPGSQDAASSGDQSPQTDTYEEIEEAEKEKRVAIPEQLKIVQPMEVETTGNQMEEDLGKCINNQPSDLLHLDNEDEDSSQNSEEEEEAEYKDSEKQEEHTSAQPNDESTVVHHQREVSIETSKEVEMQENHSILQLCTSLFPSNRSSIWRGPHSLFHRPASLRESPIHAAIATIMKP